MSASGAPSLLSQAPELAAALGYAYVKTLGAKTLPLLLLACWPRRGKHALALCWLAILLVSLLLAARFGRRPLEAAAAVAAGLLYYGGACVCTVWIARRAHALRGDVVFALMALLGVFIPALPLRAIGAPELLVLGWSLALSGYSYCKEAARGSVAPRAREALFFLLVDPTLSYPERSRPARVGAASTLKRVALASVMVLAGEQLFHQLLHLRGALASAFGARVGALVLLPLAFVGVFFSAYWVRAGAAHLRIGLMQSIGYAPPECYRQPYLSRSPTDFWRRWNCWVGVWVRRYLFMPICLQLLRSRLAADVPTRTVATKAAAVLASFMLMGLAHDWLIFSAQGETNLIYVKTFSFAGLGLLLWEGLELIARRPNAETARPLARRWVEAAYAFAYVGCMFWISGAV